MTDTDSSTALSTIPGQPVTTPDALDIGQLVRVRGQQWVVSVLDRSPLPADELAARSLPGHTLVTLTSVSDDDLGDELRLIWEIEPGREVLPVTRLPDMSATGLDDPEQLGAFLDAVLWGTVASADTRTLQAPFRSGIRIEEYQLAPVAMALDMPRVNLLIADDVGLGKTIEAGLIAQELLLRHRARRMIVVCPASLTGKWAEEMQSRFGLSFHILDADALKQLRRTHGLQANPFTVFPRTIISLQWLRSPRIQRLLDEVLTPDTRHPGFFDLLIVDEAHHCAPPAPQRGKGYAVDSKQTKAVKRLGEHSQHRLFLSATPHNGYSESWQALLEMLDPQRFARGVEPDPAIVDQVVIRRLKETIHNPDGTPRFPGRHPRAIEVAYTPGEREGHDLLARYVTRRRKESGLAAARAGDLVTLLLKKRLFSSPAAFARTLDAHIQTLRRARSGPESPSTPDAAGVTGDAVPEWLQAALAWDDEPDDDLDDMVDLDVLERSAELMSRPDDTTWGLLDQLGAWGDDHAQREDSKSRALLDELARVCRPDGEWTDERVVVFTEYLDTLNWLADILESRGYGGDRLGSIYGGMDRRHREHLKASFQARPSRSPLRILLATDAASEGIDLQNHCYRIINYDIPFNPNRLEQRIGRVDRLGQTHPVDVVHFVGGGWQDAPPESYEADLEFLSRVAVKVATEKRDLGSVNPVLAAAVESRMLGRPVLFDPTDAAPTQGAGSLRAERDLRSQVVGLRTQLDESIRRLHVAPANVRRVVDVALELAGQPPLIDLGDGLMSPPDLRAGWERTLEGLADPLDGQPRLLTFDPEAARDRDDVVLAHLDHPLVAQCTRFLRSALWGDRLDLHRVTAIRVDLPPAVESRGLLVAAYARLVVVGGDGSRLHEEVVVAGREVPASGRSRRIELDQRRYGELRGAVDAALAPGRCRPAPTRAYEGLIAAWPELAPLVAEDLRRRAEQQFESLQRTFDQRATTERQRVDAVFDQMTVTLERVLAEPLHVQLDFDDLTQPERHQVERDRGAWQSRLDGLPEERLREVAAVERRFAGAHHLVFPFAMVLCATGSGDR